MLDGDQKEIVEFLSSPTTHGGALVERIETHSAMVFLAGPRAFKLKRSVRYDYSIFPTHSDARCCARRKCASTDVRPRASIAASSR